MRLSSLPPNSAFLPDHPYVLQLVRHETEAWNNKFNRKYDTIRIQRIKLHHFPCIFVCRICCFTLWFLRTWAQCLHSIPNPFQFCKDSADMCEWKLPLKHMLLSNWVHRSMWKVKPGPRMSKQPGSRDFFASRLLSFNFILCVSCDECTFHQGCFTIQHKGSVYIPT